MVLYSRLLFFGVCLLASFPSFFDMDENQPPDYSASPRPSNDVQWFLSAIQIAALEGFLHIPFQWHGFRGDNCHSHLLKVERCVGVDPPAPATRLLIRDAKWRTGRVIARCESPEDLALSEAECFRDEGGVFHGILGMIPFESLTNNRLHELSTNLRDSQQQYCRLCLPCEFQSRRSLHLPIPQQHFSFRI